MTLQVQSQRLAAPDEDVISLRSVAPPVGARLQACENRREPSRTAPWARLTGLIHARSAFAKAFLSIFDQAVVSGTSFATAVIIGRACTREQLGLYYLTLTISLVAVGLQENVIAGPYTIFGARRRGSELAEYTGSAWVQHLALTALSMMALSAIIVWASLAAATDLLPGLWTLMWAGPLLLLREGIRRFAFARMRLFAALIVDAVTSVFQLSGLLALWYLDALSLAGIFGVMGGACGLACLGWFIFKREPSRFVRGRMRADWLENWAVGKWALLSYLTVDTIPYFMPWLVDWAAGAAATGTFGACVTLVGMANVIVGGTRNFLRPKAADSYAVGGAVALRRVLTTTAWLFVGLFGTALLAVILTGDFLPVLVFGEAFRGSGPILALLMTNLLAGSLGFIAATGLFALGQLRASFVADICMLVSTLVVAALLVGSQGALGAAMATLVGNVVGGVLKIWTLHNCLRSLPQTNARLATNPTPT